jgi:pyridoxal phosphate enzyme (YggS family)
MSAIADRYEDVCARVAAAAERAGRDPDDVTIVAVTKKFLVNTIDQARAAGITDVGENYAQELAAKYDVLPRAEELIWHFIGHLQRNKVKQVIGRADLIHTVDSERLAREIDKRAAAEDEIQPILIEVNLAGEESKSGIAVAEVEPLLEVIYGLEAIQCVGFMVMPPWPKTPEDNRSWFARLRELRDRLATDEHPLRELSMGTSGDFEVAVEEGATLVRVGTAIFGPRPTL